MKYIDLRSDTVTKPSKQMLQMILQAEFGDDVYGEDPTVNMLQLKVASLFGKDAALFVPSGVMGNQICIKVQTNPGDEIIADEDSHIFVYENAAPAAISGVSIRTIHSKSGVITAEQVKRAIRPQAYYLPKTKLICIENTHGRSGGTVFPIEEIRNIRQIANEKGIRLHLDGARIWNAHIASGIPFTEYGKNFDSLSVCLSKGLGAPIGSLILGDFEFIEKARIIRKMLGGGMRQVGVIASAGLFAIEHNLTRLKEDHLKARIFAEKISNLKAFQVNLYNVQTNMVIADIQNNMSQDEVLNLLKNNGILLTPEKDRSIRAVTHLDITMEDIGIAADVFNKLFAF